MTGISWAPRATILYWHGHSMQKGQIVYTVPTMPLSAIAHANITFFDIHQWSIFAHDSAYCFEKIAFNKWQNCAIKSKYNFHVSSG